MCNNDIRWKQRFSNFEKAFLHLRDALKKDDLSELEKAGVIQIYEFTFELAWKTIKDFLDEKKVIVKYPRDAIKEGFQYEIIDDGEVWMDMLDKRNLMSHTYDEGTAQLAFDLIRSSYFIAIEQVFLRLREEQ